MDAPGAGRRPPGPRAGHPGPAHLVPDRRLRPGQHAPAVVLVRPAAGRRGRAHRRPRRPAGEPPRPVDLLDGLAGVEAPRGVVLGGERLGGGHQPGRRSPGRGLRPAPGRATGRRGRGGGGGAPGGRVRARGHAHALEPVDAADVVPGPARRHLGRPARPPGDAPGGGGHGQPRGPGPRRLRPPRPGALRPGRRGRPARRLAHPVRGRHPHPPPLAGRHRGPGRPHLGPAPGRPDGPRPRQRDHPPVLLRPPRRGLRGPGPRPPARRAPARPHRRPPARRRAVLRRADGRDPAARGLGRVRRLGPSVPGRNLEGPRRRPGPGPGDRLAGHQPHLRVPVRLPVQVDVGDLRAGRAGHRCPRGGRAPGPGHAGPPADRGRGGRGWPWWPG